MREGEREGVPGAIQLTVPHLVIVWFVVLTLANPKSVIFTL